MHSSAGSRRTFVLTVIIGEKARNETGVSANAAHACTFEISKRANTTTVDLRCIKRCFFVTRTNRYDKIKRASKPKSQDIITKRDTRDSACARQDRQVKTFKGEGEGGDEGKIIGRARLLALARRDEGETANRSLPASVLRANRYPGASIRSYSVPVGLFSYDSLSCRRYCATRVFSFRATCEWRTFHRALKSQGANMRDEVKMDANRLIAEVYKRPALWNQRHISYHNREVTNRVWMEIAQIFNLPSTCAFSCEFMTIHIKSEIASFDRSLARSLARSHDHNKARRDATRRVLRPCVDYSRDYFLFDKDMGDTCKIAEKNLTRNLAASRKEYFV